MLSKDSFLKKNKADRVITLLLLVSIIATVIFIFSNSVQTIEASSKQSTEVKTIIAPALEPIVGEGNVTILLVRKLAHLAEFGILGFELALLMRKWFLPSFLMTLIIAAADETLQIYSNRGARLSDVLLDFFGGCLGFAVGIGFVALVRIAIKAYREKKSSINTLI